MFIKVHIAVQIKYSMHSNNFLFLLNVNTFLQTSPHFTTDFYISLLIIFCIIEYVTNKKKKIVRHVCSFICVCSSGPNPSPKRNGLWAILAIRVCTDPHFKNRPGIVHQRYSITAPPRSAYFACLLVNT